MNLLTKYIQESYNPFYPKLFELEKQRITSNLVSQKISKFQIEHFGSSAIPNCAGKKVIDIYVIVDKKIIIKASQILQNMGYEYKAHAGDKNRLFYQSFSTHRNIKILFHCHLTHFRNSGFLTDLFFRDYLKKHPSQIIKYVKIKRLGFEKIKNLKEKNKMKVIYMQTKEKFIQNIKSLQKNS